MQGVRFGAEFLTQRAVGMRIDGQVPVCGAGGWAGGFQPRAAALDGGAVSAAGDSGRGRVGLGRGLYYGAALVEAAACKDEDVYIVGGGELGGGRLHCISRNLPAR